MWSPFAETSNYEELRPLRRREIAERFPRSSYAAAINLGVMRVRVLALAAVAAGIAAVAVAAVVLAGNGEGGRPASPRSSGAPAVPEVAGPRLPALAGTDPITGKTVALEDYAGKPVVLNVWASWCEPCNAEARVLAAFERKHPKAVLVGIDMQDSVAGAKAFYRRYGWTHPVIFDPSGTLAAKLSLLGMPTTIFLTGDRRESSRIVGPVSGKTLLDGWERARRA
jgi:thiol-disulfide isomerase/thioredoxin